MREVTERAQGTGAQEAIPESVLRELRPDPGGRLRRNVLLGATGVATALSLTFWVLGASKDIDSVERIVVPLLTLLFGALTFVTWRGKLRGAEIGLMLVAGCVLLERIHFTRHEDKPGMIPVLDTYELLIWFPSVFVFAFLVFEKRQALLFGLALIAASFVVVRDWLTPGADDIYHADLSEFMIGQLGCLSLLYGFAHLKERFLSTHALAVSLRSSAETDFLTGVANRRAVTQSLQRELLRAQRHRSHLSVILLDLDDFKGINDRFGHDEGDKALRRVALLIDRSRRRTDAFGRWGGEEFLLVAPDLDLAEARNAAERLRSLIEGSSRSGPSSVTASFGVSEFKAGDDLARLVMRADQALMEAKASGRNRVATRSA